MRNTEKVSEKIVLLQPIRLHVMEDKVYFKQFDIEFVKLPLGQHELTLEVDKRFFEKHTNDEISDSEVKVRLQVEKKEHLMRFRFLLRGTVTLKCDLCLEALLFPLETEEDFIVKMTPKEEEAPEDEHCIHLPEKAFSFNVEQLVYELIYAAIPMRKVHEDYPGQQCNASMLSLLEAHQQKKNTECDPRWEALKNIKL